MNLNGCKQLKQKLINKRFQIIYYGRRIQVVIQSNCVMERAKQKKTGNQVGPEPEKDLDKGILSTP